MLPTHLPLNVLDKIIHDYAQLTSDQSDEFTPLEMLTGYQEGGEYGGMPFENPESDETDPMKRLLAGERLAIQLHAGMLQDESGFIDGTLYVATEAEIAHDENNRDDNLAFPDESGFFGVGIWLDGDRLALESVRISGDMNGNVCVSRAMFPKSLNDRTAAYLERLTRDS